MAIKVTLSIFGKSWRLTYWLWSLLASMFSVEAARANPFPTVKAASAAFPSTSIQSNGAQIQILNHQKLLLDYVPSCLRFNKKKLVLDLDETLISASLKHQGKHDVAVKVLIGSNATTFFIKKRPHLDFFIETVSQWFDLIVFTASLSVYANAVVDFIDSKRLIKKRYFRQNCLDKGNGRYIKDLSTVCNDLSKVVIIDNSPIAYSKHRENGIPIPDYLGNNHNDQALLKLLPLLEELRRSPDVRPVIQRKFHETSPQLNRIGASVNLLAFESSFYGE